MIIHRPLKDAASQGTLVINGVTLEKELRVRFLGVIFEEFLFCRDQIQYVTDKISKYVGIFYNVRSSLTVTSLILLYNSLDYSHLTYFNSVWCLHPRKYLDPLHKIQNKLVRAMSHSHYLAHSAPLMKQLSILNIYDVNFYDTCLLGVIYFKTAVKRSLLSDYEILVFECPFNPLWTKSSFFVAFRDIT